MKKATTRKETIEHLLNGGIIVTVGVPDGITPKEKQLEFYQCKEIRSPVAGQKEAEHITDVVMLLNAAGECNVYLATTETVSWQGKETDPK